MFNMKVSFNNYYLGHKKPHIVLYRLACTYSRLKNSTNGFKYLKLAIKSGYKNFKHIKRDPDLAYLRKQKEWRKLILQIEIIMKRY